MKEIIKANKVMIVYILFIIIFFVSMILFSNWRKTQCLKNNGKVVETTLGLMEKCIYGDDKE